MKKLLLAFPIVVLLAAGCNSSQQATIQTPTPVAQNSTLSPTQIPSPSPTPSASPSPTPSSNQASGWKIYSNNRVGYQFEYPASGLTLAINETIKYPDSQTNNQDLVQFAANSNDPREQQPMAYSVRTYVGVKSNSIESWIQNGGSTLSTDLADYTKRLIGGQVAYTGRGLSGTYVLYNANVYAIEAHAGNERGFDTDLFYVHLLSSFKFTK